MRVCKALWPEGSVLAVSDVSRLRCGELIPLIKKKTFIIKNNTYEIRSLIAHLKSWALSLEQRFGSKRDRHAAKDQVTEQEDQSREVLCRKGGRIHARWGQTVWSLERQTQSFVHKL